MKNKIEYLSYIALNSLMPGSFIFISSLLYLKESNQILGSLYFSLGLFLCLVTKSYLYTGIVGYIVTNEYNRRMIIPSLLGNLITAFILVSFVQDNEIIQKASEIVSNRSQIGLFYILGKSFMCGVLMYCSVEAYKDGKYIIVFLFVSSFILLGLTHCIADACYIFISRDYYSLYPLTIIFNGLGAITANFIKYGNNK